MPKKKKTESKPKRSQTVSPDLWAKAAAGAPLNAAEAAAYLDVHAKTLQRYIREHGLPAHRIAGKREFRFYAAELDAWVKHGSVQSTKRKSRSAELSGDVAAKLREGLRDMDK